jgi:hypothetical protein
LLLLFYLPIIDFLEKRGLHELLGREAMWLLSSCNYLNIPHGLFWGRSSLGSSSYHWFTHSSSSSLTTASLCALGMRMETNGRKRRDIVEWM